MKTCSHFWSYLAQFFLEWETFLDKCCRENQNAHFVFCNFFFFKNRDVYEIMWKYFVERGRPQMAKWRMAHCMLETWGYIRTLRACNIYSFSTSTMVAWILLIVTSYVHCCVLFLTWSCAKVAYSCTVFMQITSFL
jgi:hypothetical protein